jgi:hypothetical protein
MRKEFNGSSFVLTPGIGITVCLGAPKEWESLFKWLDEYLHETLQEKLEFLTNKTWVKWELPIGPALHWI